MESILKESNYQDRSRFAELLSRASALDLPYTENARNRPGRPAAVLALFSLPEGQGSPRLLITRRTETVETHKGQIAFPGGADEPEDADSVATALRETFEEVGASPAEIEVAGVLPRLWTVTGFQVTPVLGVHKVPFERVMLSPNPHEIAELSWIEMRQLLQPGVYSLERREWQGRVYDSHVYQVGDYRIWGATAFMIKNLLDRLDKLASLG